MRKNLPLKREIPLHYAQPNTSLHVTLMSKYYETKACQKFYMTLTISKVRQKNLI